VRSWATALSIVFAVLAELQARNPFEGSRIFALVLTHVAGVPRIWFPEEDAEGKPVR
jgi:hypothetical protein